MGLNESTWLKTPPPPEVVAWASQEVGAQVRPLTAEAWARLLENAGLKDLIVRMHGINARDETREMLRRYGGRGMLRVFWRLLGLFARNPAYRRFVKRVSQGGIMPENLQEYFGYGLYVGRK